MSGLFSSSQTSGGTTTSGPDQLTQMIRKMIMPYAFNIANQSYPGYDANSRVQPFSYLQNQGFGDISKYAGQGANPDYYQYAQDQDKAYGAAPAGHVNTYSAVDETKTPVGSIKSYMDPYVGNVVNNQIRQVNETAQRDRIQNGQEATFAGGFGDARHGVADALTAQKQMQTVGDVTGQGYSNAYNSAMGLREQDLGRFFQQGQTNQALREQQLGRKLGSAQNAMDFGTANSADYMQRLQALMNAGGMQQQQGQHVKDAQYENYLRGVEWPFRQYDALLSMMTGQPSTQQVQTSQTSSGGSGIWGLLGSILGGFAGGGA